MSTNRHRTLGANDRHAFFIRPPVIAGHEFILACIQREHGVAVQDLAEGRFAPMLLFRANAKLSVVTEG